MSGSRNVAIRVGLEGDEAVKQRLEALRVTGDTALRRLEDAGRRAAGGTAALGQSTGEAATQMRALAQQMPDVVQGLLSGQSAFQLLIQQGGQVAQTTGGVGAAFRTLVAYMGGPYVAAGIAAGAALGALAARSADLINEQRQLDVALRGVGRSAEISAGQITAYIRALEKQGVSRGDARGIGAEIARTQGLSAASGAAVSRLAPDLAAALGVEVPAAAKQLIEALSGGYDAVKKLDGALNFLTADQQKAIRTMLEHGEQTKALGVATEALEKQIGGLHKQALTPAAQAMVDLKNNWSGFMDAVAKSQPVMLLIKYLNQSVQGLSMMVNGAGASPVARPGDAEEDQAAGLVVRRAGLLARYEAAARGDGPALTAPMRASLESEIGRLGQQIETLRAQRDNLRAGNLPTGLGLPDSNFGVAELSIDPTERQRGSKIIEEQAAAIAKRDAVLRQGLPERARFEAHQKALAEGTEKGLKGTQLETYARNAGNAAYREAADAAGQHAASISREGKAALDLAAASEQGRAAMLRATAAAEAHEQAATQAGASEQGLTQAILNRNAAQEAAKGAEAVVALREQVEATQALIAAEQQGPRASYYAAIDEKIRAGTVSLRAARDATTDPAIRAALDKQIQQFGDLTRQSEELNEQLKLKREMLSDSQAIEIAEKELELVGASVSVREREVAILKARQQLRLGPNDTPDEDQQAFIDSKARLADVSSELRRQQSLYQELGGIGERAMDRIGDAAVDAAFSGGKAAVNWGNVWRSVIASVAADMGKLAVVNPVMNAVFGGERNALWSAGGGGGSLFGQLGQLTGLSNFLPEGFGLSSLLSTPLMFGQAGATQAALGAMGGAYGPATLGQLQGAGMIGTGASLGSALGGIGAGFGAGMFLNQLVGGKQTGGMVGSGLGAAAGVAASLLIPGVGAIIGPLLGGLLGGAGGGLLGGLFGPNQPNNGFGFAVRANGGNDGWATGTGLTITDPYYNEQGRSTFEQGTALVNSLNEFLAANSLTVYGARSIGGSRHGMGGLGYGEASSFQELLSSFVFGSSANAGLNAYLQGQSFDDPAKLAAAVQGFQAAEAAIKALTTDAIPAFTQQMTALNDNFDAAAEQARKYGLSESELTAARAEAIAALQAQRDETLRQSDVALTIRSLAAQGNDQQAALARQAENARQELEALGRALDAMALPAEQRAARLVALEEVQAAERLAIVRQYGEQAAQALRQAGGSIRSYLDGLATGTAAGASPTDRLAAAQAAFARDRTLAMGGDRDALGRITQSADALLGAGRDVYASGSGFQSILASVKSGLGSLPVVQSYDAMQAASLSAIEAAITNGTLSTETVILPTGNIVQLAGGLDLSAVVAALGVTNGTLGNVVATLVNGMTTTNTTLVNGLDTLARGTDVVARAAAAANDNIVIGYTSNATAQAILNNSLVTGLSVLATIQATSANAANTIAAAGVEHLAGIRRSATALLPAVDDLAGIRRSATAIFQATGVLATGLATVNGSVVAGNAALATTLVAALNAGNTIAAQASANTTNSFAAMNSILAQSNTNTIAALNAGNTIEAAGVSSIVSALNAGNTIAAANGQTLFYLNNYASFAFNALEAANVYAIEQRDLTRVLIQKIERLEAALAEVTATIQTGSRLVATEVRDGGRNTVGAIDATTAQVRRLVA